MPKLISTIIALLIFSGSSQAFEPELQQQGMVYFHLSFDAGQPVKPQHFYGFRLDNGLVKPGESMHISTLMAKPAVMDINFNQNGLRSFAMHGIEFTEEVYVARGAESTTDETASTEDGAAAETAEPEAVEATPQRDIKLPPLGVLIGAAIGIVAIAGGGN